MNEDDKIATISAIRNKDSASNELMNIIEEIKANLKDGKENRAVPYYAIKDIELLEVKGTYQSNQLVKSSDISFNSTPIPDPTPPVQETYNYDIPVTINNIHGSNVVERNAITIKFGNFVINVPDTDIELEKVEIDKSIQRSGTSKNFTTDIIINFNSSSFRNNYDITCACNGIKNESAISSSASGQTEIKLENVTLINNEKGFKNTINISIAAAS